MENCMIFKLPSELVSMILENVDCTDIINFGFTCKHFYDEVKNNQILWKAKFKVILPIDVFHIVQKHGTGDWFSEVKFFYTTKQKLYSEITNMSPQYYWKNTDITYEDVRIFFSIALSNNLSYYYTIYILQDMLRKCRKYVNDQKCVKPYTLTEAYYAKLALRHLIHTYLAVKWVKLHVKEELSPEIVFNFFLQWVDTDNLHLDEDVDNKIMEYVHKAKAVLKFDQRAKTTKPGDNTKEPINEGKVLDAVTQVLYTQQRFAVTTSVNLDTLDIIKVLNNKCGSIIVAATVYQSVARRLGVQCELFAFPNHLFLEWVDKSDPRKHKTYTVDLYTGTLRPKRRCPFSQGDRASTPKYYPDSLLQYIYTSFHMSMGAIKNWNTQNAFHLLDFLGTHDNDYNPYRNFLPYLLDSMHLPAMDVPLNLKYLDNIHIQVINALSNINAGYKPVTRNTVVKIRDNRIKFAVGMICYHKKYEYVCIVCGWDYSCAVEWQRRMETEVLEFGPKQPFYHVIAADQSKRYVPEENLIEKIGPQRIFHLEDMIAREFATFDGFAYVPNDEKRAEYPNEDAIVNFYRNHCELRAHTA